MRFYFIFFMWATISLGADINNSVAGSESEIAVQAFPAVTVAVATYEPRHAYHELLYKSFKTQDYQGKLQLMVYDNGEKVSPFFSTLNDDSVVYKHTNQKITLGAKRNWLAENASGEYIAVFDDDDFYGANYISFMIEQMINKKSSFIKTRSWVMCHFDRDGKNLEFHDVAPGTGDRFADRHTWGFSFVYKKSIFTDKQYSHCRYREGNRGEEDNFARIVDDISALRYTIIDFKTLDKKSPLMIKFEHYTPKSAQEYPWPSTFDFNYNREKDKKLGRRFWCLSKDELNAVKDLNKEVIDDVFSAQIDLLNIYIDTYKNLGSFPAKHAQ